jgi:hypothetical protein
MNQNQSEKDELEDAFLSIDFELLEKKITPNKELSNYELDVKEIMNIGCNRQLAEYVLNKIEINLKLKEENKKYLEAKNKFINKIKGTINIKEILEKVNKNALDIDVPTLYEKIFFEEIIEEIMDKYLKENYEFFSEYGFKSNLIKEIKENKKLKFDLDEFIKSKKEYIEKRQPIIEAALRLARKILNDEKEYKNFYEYYNNNTNNNIKE